MDVRLATCRMLRRGIRGVLSRIARWVEEDDLFEKPGEAEAAQARRPS